MLKEAPVLVPGAVEIRLAHPSQLFNTLDPFPFRQRDLAPEAAEYIIDWAEELPKDEPIQIVIHLPPSDEDHEAAPDLAQAISSYFAARDKAEGLNIRALLRDGRRAFAIGLILIAVFLTLAWRLSLNFEGTIPSIFQESLVIIGWVIIWRPAEMFLYDWVPMARRRKLFRRLAASAVTVKYDLPAAAEGG